MRFNKSTKLYCCIGRILQWNQRNFRALKHSTWYHNNAYMSLYICLNPCMSALRMSHDENHGLGWLWCVSAGSLVLTSHSAWACWWWRKLCIRGAGRRFTGPNQSLSLGMLMMKEAMHTGAGRRYVGNLWISSSIFL